jgi:hypothetical protein
LQKVKAIRARKREVPRMGSFRSHRHIAAPADRLWALIGDSLAVPTWFSSIAECAVEGDVRTCKLVRGGEVRERIVTQDNELRRFQYSIIAGIPVSSHLGTIDVLAIDPGSSIVVYSTEVQPDAVGAHIGSAVERALDKLVQLFESDAQGRGGTTS